MSHRDDRSEPDPRRTLARTGRPAPLAALMLALAGGAGLATAGLAGCEGDEPVEEAAEETGEAMEDAADEVEDAADEMGG